MQFENSPDWNDRQIWTTVSVRRYMANGLNGRAHIWYALTTNFDVNEYSWHGRKDTTVQFLKNKNAIRFNSLIYKDDSFFRETLFGLRWVPRMKTVVKATGEEVDVLYDEEYFYALAPEYLFANCKCRNLNFPSINDEAEISEFGYAVWLFLRNSGINSYYDYNREKFVFKIPEDKLLFDLFMTQSFKPDALPKGVYDSDFREQQLRIIAEKKLKEELLAKTRYNEFKKKKTEPIDYYPDTKFWSEQIEDIHKKWIQRKY